MFPKIIDRKMMGGLKIINFFFDSLDELLIFTIENGPTNPTHYAIA